MKLRAGKSRGVFFITALLVAVLVVMMVTAALMLLPGGRFAASSVEEDSAAQAAAQAGLEYARTRMQFDPEWRGDGNAVTVDMPGQLWVREDRGNVVGILWSQDQVPSLFRLRFNFQNGTEQPDDANPDPAPDMQIPLKYVSYNLLEQGGSAPLYRADGANFSVTESSVRAGEVPRHTAVLYCEGLSGAGVRDITPDQPRPSDQFKVTRRVLEQYMRRDVSAYGDAVVYGAQDISFDLEGRLRVGSENSNMPPRMRTLADIGLSSSDANPLEMNNGEVFVNKEDGRFLINSADSESPVATQEDSSASFIKLGWGDLDLPTPSDATMKAGTYVWRDHPRRLDYYAVDYDPAVGLTGSPSATYTATSQDGLASLDGAVSLNPLELEMRITKNIAVAPQGSANGMAVLVDTGLLTSALKRPKNSLVKPTWDSPAPILSSQGDIRIQGTLEGQGSVNSHGSIHVQGSSVMEANPNHKVALFAKEDITIEAVPGAIAQALDAVAADVLFDPDSGYSSPPYFEQTLPSLGALGGADVGFTGVVYAQGDINFDLDNGRDRGNLYLRGVMVAYGGNYEPARGQRNLPGTTPGKGRIGITAKGVDFRYDSSYVDQLRNQAGGIPLGVVSWRAI